MLLVFSYEHSKPKAIAPLLPIIGGVLGGLIIEEMAHMGIKWGTKEIAKKKADDFAAAWLANPANKFDFAGSNPYLNKDGSVYITPSARDRAKVASLLAGALGGMAIEDYLSGNEGACAPPVGSGVEVESGDLVAKHAGIILNKFYDTKLEPPPNPEYFNWSRFISRPKVEGDPYHLEHGDFYHESNNWRIVANSYDYATRKLQTTVYSDSHPAGYKQTLTVGRVTNTAFMNFIQVETVVPDVIMYCNDGLYIPSTLDNVYRYPSEIPQDYILPNQSDLEGLTIVIKNIMPPTENEGEITWTDIQNNFADAETAIQALDNGTVNYLEQGLIVNGPYTETVINNYYTDIGKDKKREDVEKELEVLPVPEPDGDNLPVPIQPIDKNLLVIAKESYQYLADTVKTSIDGLTAVTAGAAGIITFLGTTMGWLPDEWIVMFSAAFGLGLFAFFFRR